jgi:hypothetical protein
MSTDIYGKVTRDGAIVYQNILFQIDRMSAIEAMSYSQPPHFLYDGFCTGPYVLRQNDYIVDLYNVDPVTNQPKAYQIINEPEPYPNGYIEFSCARADRAALTMNS